MRYIKALLTFLAGIALVAPADAAILWFGGEDTSVTLVGTAPFNTTGQGYDTNYARISYEAQNSTTVADPPANRMTSPTFTASSSIWIHAHVYIGTTATTTSGEQGLLVRSPDGVSRLILRQTGTTGQLKISSRNSAGTITDLATASSNYSSDTNFALDIHIDYTCSGAGSVTVYYATASVIAFTGNPCTDAATTLNQVEFASLSNGNSQNCSTGVGTCWSEMIVADEDTRSMRLATLTLQSAGNTQGWTPSTLGNVNEALINDATLISDPTGNVLSQWKVPSSAPTGTWTVKSVSIEARMQDSLTGPQNFDWSWRISNADYLSGLTNALTNSFANYRIQQNTSPATTSTWSISEVYNSSTNQMNIGVKSLP